MKQCIIFYFSGTGNTKWVSDLISDNLSKNKFDTKAVSIESQSKSSVESHLESSDVIGFGYPIYGSDLPEPMKNFIDELEVLKKRKKTFVFCTQMAFSGDGSFVYEKTLNDKGFDIIQTEHITMPNNISVMPWLFHILPDSKKQKVLEKAKRKIKRFSQYIIDEKRHYKGKYGYLLGIMQRGPYQKMYSSFQDMLSVDAKICIKCGRCARLCPVQNITLIDGIPSFNKKCAQCLRCYNFCPPTAIMYNGKHHNQKKELYRGPDKSFKPEHLKRDI